MKANTIWDNLISLGAVAFFAAPTFWLGIMLMIVFSVRLGWLPVGGMQPGLPLISHGGIGKPRTSSGGLRSDEWFWTSSSSVLPLTARYAAASCML